MTNRTDTVALKDAAAVVEVLSELGVLFLSDPKRRNAVEVVTGEFPKGSWWSNPRSNEIYGILQEVEGHGDVLLAKVLAGKVTLIHRALWPQLLAVATAREPWQTQGLSEVASRWLAAFDEAEATGAPAPQPSRTVSKEIEVRLLVFAETVHSPSGKHETKVESWRSWAARVGQQLPDGPTPAAIAEAKRAIETAAGRLGPPPPQLPWAS